MPRVRPYSQQTCSESLLSPQLRPTRRDSRDPAPSRSRVRLPRLGHRSSPGVVGSRPPPAGRVSALVGSVLRFAPSGSPPVSVSPEGRWSQGSVRKAQSFDVSKRSTIPCSVRVFPRIADGTNSSATSNAGRSNAGRSNCYRFGRSPVGARGGRRQCFFAAACRPRPRPWRRYLSRAFCQPMTASYLMDLTRSFLSQASCHPNSAYLVFAVFVKRDQNPTCGYRIFNPYFILGCEFIRTRVALPVDSDDVQ